MAKGTVRRWMNEKGFGFISPIDGGKDIFVHHSAIEGHGKRNLVEGDEVFFEVVQGQKGPQAANVKPASLIRRG